jgi:DNA-directed RNA polymerase specialized sigma24 family protein
VAQAVAALEPMQRLLLDLRYIDDAPVAEIASVVGTSSAAVSQRFATIYRTIARETRG